MKNLQLDQQNKLPKINLAKVIDYTKERLYFILRSSGGCGSATNESTKSLTQKLKQLMSKNVQLFRNKELLQEALVEISKIKRAYARLKIKGDLVWNVELIEYIELGNLLISAEATTRAAQWRAESRGCHYRSDFPEKKKEFKSERIFIVIKKATRNFIPKSLLYLLTKLILLAVNP